MARYLLGALGAALGALGGYLVGVGLCGCALGMRSTTDPATISRGAEVAVFIAGCIGAAIVSLRGAKRFVEFYDRWVRWP